MKKIFMMLVVTAMVMLTTQELRADGSGEKRKNCYDVLRFRYKAISNITSKYTNTSISDKNSGCNPITAIAQTVSCLTCPHGVIRDWGYSKTLVNSSGVHHSFQGNPNYFNHGYKMNQEVLSQESFNNLNNVNEISAQADVNALIDFVDNNSTTNNNIVLNGFNASILLPLNDLSSRYTYELVIWNALDEDDSTITAEKILWQTGFIYTNNNISRTGYLLGGTVSYVQTDSSNEMFLSLVDTSLISISASGSIRITAVFHKDDFYNSSSSIIAEKDNKDGIMNDLGLKDVKIYQSAQGSLEGSLVSINQMNTIPSIDAVVISIYTSDGINT